MGPSRSRSGAAGRAERTDGGGGIGDAPLRALKIASGRTDGWDSDLPPP
jgi:hypothetical protein